MEKLILFLFEWVGSVFILLGIFYLATKSAKDPRNRKKGFIIMSIGCVLVGIFGFLISAYGVMVVQIGVILSSIYGIYNCNKEINDKEFKGMANNIIRK
jgi:hypothetical protein